MSSVTKQALAEQLPAMASTAAEGTGESTVTAIVASPSSVLRATAIDAILMSSDAIVVPI
jgi:hypothetical protein